MRNLFILAAFMCTCCVVVAQPVHDRDFQMVAFDDCKPLASDAQIFSKVEVDPVVHSLSKTEFLEQMSLAVDELELVDTCSGTIKLKFLFPIDEDACLRAIGFHDLATIDKAPASIIASHLPGISSFTSGLQRGQPQICQGIVFLQIDYGKVVASRVANFSFSRK